MVARRARGIFGADHALYDAKHAPKNGRRDRASVTETRQDNTRGIIILVGVIFALIGIALAIIL